MTTPPDQPPPRPPGDQPTGDQPTGEQPPGPPPYGGPPPGPPPYGEQPPGQPASGGPPPGPAYGGPPSGQPAYGGPPRPGAPAPLAPDQERTWGLVAHLSAFAGSLVGGLTFLGPLIVMLTMGERSPFVRRHAVEALNFNLSVLIYALVSLLTLLVLIGFVLLPLVVVAWAVLTIVAAVKANQGEEYRYPFTIRFVK
ncbi:MAG TPA: DUF4870 domain-containing protein [Jiangellales bacterium]|nr:DUF4870 domain-containing protein [Jiangellales bacterium]